MVVAVQQPLADCTAYLTSCIVEHQHLPVQRQYTKPAQINSGTVSKTEPSDLVRMPFSRQNIYTKGIEY